MKMKSYTRDNGHWDLSRGNTLNNNWRKPQDFKQGVYKDLLKEPVLLGSKVEKSLVTKALFDYGVFIRVPLIQNIQEEFVERLMENTGCYLKPLITGLNNSTNMSLVPFLDKALTNIVFKNHVKNKVSSHLKHIKKIHCLDWEAELYDEVMEFLKKDLFKNGKNGEINKGCIALDPLGRWLLECAYGIDIQSLII